jgi:translation elongation factor EF-Ts
MYPYHHFIQCYSHHGRVAVLVEFGLETSLITERAEFLELSRNVAMHVAGMNPESIPVLLHQPYVKDPSLTLREFLDAGSKSLGERITVTRFSRWDIDHPPRPPTADTPSPPRTPAVIMKFKSGK